MADNEISAYRNLAKHAQEQIDNLIATYGTGVRPSWVSEDIAITAAQRDRYLAQANDLETRT